MSQALADHKLEFEDRPLKITPFARMGGKDSKMPKSNKAVESSTAKTYNKTRGEHIKDMVIVALVVGIVAFGLGFKFNADRNAEMQSAVKAAQTATVSTDTVKK